MFQTHHVMVEQLTVSWWNNSLCHGGTTPLCHGGTTPLYHGGTTHCVMVEQLTVSWWNNSLCHGGTTHCVMAEQPQKPCFQVPREIRMSILQEKQIHYVECNNKQMIKLVCSKKLHFRFKNQKEIITVTICGQEQQFK